MVGPSTHVGLKITLNAINHFKDQVNPHPQKKCVRAHTNPKRTQKTTEQKQKTKPPHP